MLTGDFRILADELSELRATGRITGDHRKIRHKELIDALKAITGNMFKGFNNNTIREGESTMCELIDKWMKDIRQEGYNDALKAITGNVSKGFNNTIREEESTMCETIDKWMKEIHENGEKQGFANGVVTIARSLLSANMSDEFVHQHTGLSLAEIQQLRAAQ